MIKSTILRTTLLTIILLLFFSLQYHFFSSRTQSFAFADENEHLVPGWMMSLYSKHLYVDLTTNHQPLPIIAAGLLHSVAKPPNLTMTIERTRQMMLFLSFVGALFLTVRFGPRGLLASIVIELSKFYLFGYHLLAEALVVYPIMYLAGLLAIRRFHKLDDLLVGFSVFLLTFNLLPLWPFILAYLVFYVKVKGPAKINFGVLVLSFLLPTIFLFVFLNPLAWWQQTVINNLRYFLPYETGLKLQDLFLLPVLPLLGLLHAEEPLARQYLLLFALFVLGFRRQLKLALGLYFLFILLNNRIASLGVSFYGAFHLLPQLAYLTMVAVMAKVNRLIFVAFLILLFLNSGAWWRESGKFNKEEERFVNYSTEESIGMAVAAVASPSDVLLAGLQSGFVNLAAKVPLATSQTAYLPWAHRVPEISAQVSRLSISPPSFIYFPSGENPFFRDLKPMLEESYFRISRTDGRKTDLYVLVRKAKTISVQQWQHFSFLLYQPPTTQPQKHSLAR